MGIQCWFAFVGLFCISLPACWSIDFQYVAQPPLKNQEMASIWKRFNDKCDRSSSAKATERDVYLLTFNGDISEISFLATVSPAQKQLPLFVIEKSSKDVVQRHFSDPSNYNKVSVPRFYINPKKPGYLMSSDYVDLATNHPTHQVMVATDGVYTYWSSERVRILGSLVCSTAARKRVKRLSVRPVTVKLVLGMLVMRGMKLWGIAGATVRVVDQSVQEGGGSAPPLWERHMQQSIVSDLTRVSIMRREPAVSPYRFMPGSVKENYSFTACRPRFVDRERETSQDWSSVLLCEMDLFTSCGFLVPPEDQTDVGLCVHPLSGGQKQVYVVLKKMTRWILAVIDKAPVAFMRFELLVVPSEPTAGLRTRLSDRALHLRTKVREAARYCVRNCVKVRPEHPKGLLPQELPVWTSSRRCTCELFSELRNLHSFRVVHAMDYPLKPRARRVIITGVLSPSAGLDTLKSIPEVASTATLRIPPHRRPSGASLQELFRKRSSSAGCGREATILSKIARWDSDPLLSTGNR